MRVALMRVLVLLLAATLVGFGLAMWNGPLWGKVAISLLSGLGLSAADAVIGKRLSR